MSRTYWLHGNSKTAISHLEEVREKSSSWNNSPMRQTWIRNYLAYYSPAIAPTSWDTSLIFEGVQGELTRFYSPKARTLIQKLVTLCTKQRLAFNCLAQTKGSDVIQDVKLGNALVDQIIQNERLDIKIRELCEGGLVTGAWFTEVEWRTDKGKPYTRAENGSVIYTGGIEIGLRSVFDVFYDVTIPHWEQQTCVETRTLMNRWDLIAQHPELEDKIIALPSALEARGSHAWFDRVKADSDTVYVYKAYAKPTPSLLSGRMIIYGAADCVFYDDENIYDGIPVEPNIPEKVLGTGFGYPQLTNIIAAQEMFDNSLSAIATNQAQFAVQGVTIARGSNVNVQELNGMRFVSFTPQNVPGGGKPEPLQLTQSSPETFKFADMLDKVMMDLSNINPALAGNPQPGVTSGVAIATLTANAMEFINGVAGPLFLCLEKTMEHAVNCYKKFAKLPQNVTMKSRNNQVINRDFTGKQLECISGVKIQISNPLLQTIAGRLEIAEKLMQMPREMWPQYVSVLEGRPLNEIYRGDLSQMDCIYMENEFLVQGQQTPVLATDDHAVHIQEHAGLLNDPAIRMNGPTIQVILDHMEMHKTQALSVDPMLTAMIRTGKMPQLPPPSQQQPPPGGINPNMGLPTGEVAEPAEDALQRGGA